MLNYEDLDSQRVFAILERVLFLKDVDLFRNVDTERLSLIAEIARETVYNPGDVVVRENDVADSLYLVKQGALNVLKEKEGKSYPIAQVKTGGCFGELEIFGDRRRTSGAVAMESTVLLELRKNEFKKVLISNPEIAYNLLEILSDRVRALDDEVVLLNRTLNANLRRDLEQMGARGA